MINNKVNLVELNRMFREGHNLTEIAKHFGVSKSAISQAKQKLKRSIIPTISLDKANEVVESDMDIIGQLKKVNRAIMEDFDKAREELDQDGCKDKRALQEIIIKLAAEIRKQMSDVFNMVESWYDHRAIAEFQGEVLNVIESVEPGKRDEILKRLAQKSALRSVIAINI